MALSGFVYLNINRLSNWEIFIFLLKYVDLQKLFNNFETFTSLAALGFSSGDLSQTDWQHFFSAVKI